MFKNLSIRKKLIVIFLLISLIPMIGVTIFSTIKSKESMEDMAIRHLISIRESKKAQIEHYFEMIRDQAIEHSRESMMIDAVKDFTEAFSKAKQELNAVYESNIIENESNLKERYQYQKDNTYDSPSDAIAKWWPEERATHILQHLYISSNPEAIGHKHELDYAHDGSTYSKAHKKYHPLIREYLKRIIGYYDIFLIEPENGFIVYSVFKELDFATSLLTGPYRRSGLAKAFKASLNSNSKDSVFFIDFEHYEPSYNQPAAFIASPIYDGENKVGVLAFQIPIDEIDKIMTSHRRWKNVGFGNSVEAYLVGKDFTMRNDSRSLIEAPDEYFKQIEQSGYNKEIINKIKALNTTILLQEVKTPGTEDALRGNSAVRIFPDYRNIRVFSAYTPLNIDMLKWSLMVEINEDEVLGTAKMLRNIMFVVIIAVTILVMITGIFITQGISSPIRILSKQAEEIGRGNLTKRINIKSKDEIGILANSFNKMAENLEGANRELQEYSKTLEIKIRERTRELEDAKAGLEDSVEKRTKELQERVTELERYHDATVDRELRMKELRERIKELERKDEG